MYNKITHEQIQAVKDPSDLSDQHSQEKSDRLTEKFCVVSKSSIIDCRDNCLDMGTALLV